MEYYHYVNIFETKGLEYILVICFMITFVLFVRRLNMPPKDGRSGNFGGPPGAIVNGEVIVVPDEGHAEVRAEDAKAETGDSPVSGPPDS